jgi:hypothetical protein
LTPAAAGFTEALLAAGAEVVARAEVLWAVVGATVATVLDAATALALLAEVVGAAALLRDATFALELLVAAIVEPPQAASNPAADPNRNMLCIACRRVIE